ncbi:MAG TPA: PspC domain-containing protein [Aeromicrobium sp.]|nr:PspC domain-containing protein [Aeromicrobium sp.]
MSTPASSDGLRRAFRPLDSRVIGGVAAGLAEHFSVPVIWIRIGFVVATFINGIGIIAYLLCWRFLPLQTPESSPGAESAMRQGLSPERSGAPAREIAQSVALIAVGGGVLLLIGLAGDWLSGWMLPVLVVVSGVALLWRLVDDSTWNSWIRQTRGPGSLVRLLVGVCLIGVGLLYLLTVNQGWRGTLDFAAAFAVALVGLSLVMGPWIVGLMTDLGRERRERIRSQERADVAAHLHDSVLQTLALLQRNSTDPAMVATLARRQERELRDWLYGQEPEAETFGSGLRQLANEIEADHQVPVEVVVVGDAPVTDGVRALIAATGEAVTNAAKHSTADRIDVYAERTAGPTDLLEVFIRDRGIGFDPAAIEPHRQGVRKSIIERMERHGGTAKIRSAPAAGTEVTLTMPAPTHENGA